MLPPIPRSVIDHLVSLIHKRIELEAHIPEPELRVLFMASQLWPIPAHIRNEVHRQYYDLLVKEKRVMEKNTQGEKFTRFLATIPPVLMPIFTGIEDIRSTFHRLVNVFSLVELRRGDKTLTDFELGVIKHGRATCALLLEAFDKLENPQKEV